MLKIGDRVLGRRPPEDNWYPGTIRHSVGTRFYVIFEDGEDALLAPEQLRPLRWEPGDTVFARRAPDGDYEPARITDKAEDRLLLAFEDGEEAWTALGLVRVRPGAGPPAWGVCDRVLACWFDLDWYPGIVLGADNQRVHVLFDNGSQGPILPQRVRAFKVEAGDQVLCRWGGGPEYYPGQITRVQGEKIHIRYEDGDEEWTSVRLLRLQRDDWLPGGELRHKVGDRVLACWFDGNWYPGLVLAVEGKRVHIAFYDSDQALVTPDQVRDLVIRPGDAVQCRRSGGPQFVAAEVTEQEGEKVRVRYDDGEEEWTGLRMVRIEP